MASASLVGSASVIPGEAGMALLAFAILVQPAIYAHRVLTEAEAPTLYDNLSRASISVEASSNAFPEAEI